VNIPAALAEDAEGTVPAVRRYPPLTPVDDQAAVFVGCLLPTTSSAWAAHWPPPFSTRPTTTASVPMSASCPHGSERQSPTATPGLRRRRLKPKHTRPC